MNESKETNAQDTRPQVDEQRRRLTRGGLVAPIVLGSLLSRPVLGAAPHNCTISGQLSGNVSTHEQGVCSSLGTKIASDWIGLWPEWPDKSDFYNNNRKPFAYARLFEATPNSLTQFASNSYKATANNTSVTTRDATVLEVLLGYVPIYDAEMGTYTPAPDNNFTLTATRPVRAPILLGQESIVAYLNAIVDAPDFPLNKAEVVTIFNSIYGTGSYAVVSGSATGNWNTADVLQYFQSLHV